MRNFVGRFKTLIKEHLARFETLRKLYVERLERGLCEKCIIK